LAGAYGRAGSVDGPADQALFSDQEKGIAADGTGAVYVADAFNQMVRRISPGGVVSTLAGSPSKGSQDAAGTDAQFFRPLGVAVAADGTVYVADTSNDTIRKITPAGVVSTIAGTAGRAGSTDGAVGNAQFDSPQGVAVDKNGNVYVADSGNHLIRKVTPAGVVSTVAGKK
jgi:DNA-binding beta-propeller fold protein YncE